MTDMELARPTLHVNRKLVVAGAVLVGTGGVLGAAGILVGTFAVATATRDWMRQLEVPPSQMARQKLQQARLASAAAAEAWRSRPEKSTSS